MTIAIAQRIKSGIEPDNAKSDLAGTVIGRLYLNKEIQKHHFEAAEHFAADLDRWLSISGIGRGTARGSSLMTLMSGTFGSSMPADPPQEVIERSKKCVEAARTFLRVNIGPDEYFATMNAMESVLIRDELPSPGSVHVLRSALNILARHYRLAAHA